jgi:AcrR family transcriptional regulator
MGVAERKMREKQRRLNDILDAAEEVFFAGDGMQASMDDVAKKAEVSKGTLYLYFKNKESLYLGIGARANSVVHEMLSAAVTEDKTGMEQVKAISENYYEFAKRYPNYFKIKSLSDDMTELAFKALKDDPLGQQCHEAAMACAVIMRGAVVRGIEDGTIRSDVDPNVTTALLWSQANGVISMIQIKGAHLEEFMGLTIVDIWNGFQDMIHRALAPNDCAK